MNFITFVIVQRSSQPNLGDIRKRKESVLVWGGASHHSPSSVGQFVTCLCPHLLWSPSKRLSQPYSGHQLIHRRGHGEPEEKLGTQASFIPKQAMDGCPLEIEESLDSCDEPQPDTIYLFPTPQISYVLTSNRPVGPPSLCHCAQLWSPTHFESFDFFLLFFCSLFFSPFLFFFSFLGFICGIWKFPG